MTRTSIFYFITILVAVITVRSSKIDLNLESLSPPDEDMGKQVRFYLYTRLHNDTPIQLEIENVTFNDQFKAEGETKILIHGYRSDRGSPVIQSLKEGNGRDMCVSHATYFTAYLRESDCNVIAVDWGDLAFVSKSLKVARDDIGVSLRGPNYPVAKNNTYRVGEYIALFIGDLVTRGGADLERMHLIGHSLGAHTAGVAGAAVSQGQVARITGLDPSGIYFSDDPPSRRLDVSDAVFVDVLHTNYRDGLGGARSLGYKEACGHVDYYINGGAQQPSCCSEGHCDEICSHRKAYEYWERLVLDRTAFPAFKCASLAHVAFNTYTCPGYPKCDRSSHGNFMGDVLRSHGIYYVYAESEGCPKITSDEMS